MKINIILILIILFIYLIKKRPKYNINNNILPFGYQYTEKINTGTKKDFYNLIKKYGTNKDYDLTKKIDNLKKIYAPTWGFKINKNHKIEFEMYFYIYNPIDRKYEKDLITIDKLSQVLKINTDHKENLTMFSIDYENYEYPNYYYFTSTDEIKDIGFSEKKSKLNNHYYRYFPNTIDNKFIKYVDKKLINDDLSNFKSVFIADKTIRKFYGIYYDGIKYEQVKYFLEKYNYPIDILYELNKNNYYSVSVDYNKDNNNIEKIGIYGLLY